MTSLQRINYPQLGEVKAPYVHAVKHHGTLYLSGLTAYGTSAQRKGLADQADAIFQQIKQVTAAENIGFEALIKVTIFVTSLVERASLREVLFHHFGQNLPASSLVQVSGLFSPDLMIEIEAVFAVA